MYRTIKKDCFYFEKKKPRTFEDAAQNCKTKFGGRGRLFEPRTIASNNHVTNYAMEEKNEQFWIGVRAKPHDHTRKFYYLSEGPSVGKQIF